MNKLILSMLFFASMNVHAEQLNHCKKDEATFEVSELAFKFELGDLKHLNILNGSAASAFLQFKNGAFPDLNIITTSEDLVTGGASKNSGYKKLGVDDLNGFFNKLKEKSTEGEYLHDIKTVFNAMDAKSIVIKSVNSMTIYTLINNMDGKDVIYIQRKKDPRIIMLVSDLDPQNLDKLYSQICY